jgi:hypothetical protein
VRTLLAGVACFTVAASGWLVAMAVVQHRPGYATLVGLGLLFALQSLLTLGFLVGRLPGPGARIVLVAGGAGALVPLHRAASSPRQNCTDLVNDLNVVILL